MSDIQGNDSERWKKLLDLLDEKLQLGLLDHLNKLKSYHFESDNLYLEPENKADAEYFENDAFFQQLKVLANDAVGVENVIIKDTES